MYYEKVKNLEEYMIKWRRHFHENPELSGEEFETLETLKKELDNLGIDFIEIEDGGILGFIKGEKPGDKKVLLRADIDALPVQEKPNNLAGPRVCQSKNDGKMHACGHDGHMAMLLGAAKILLEEKENFGGEVILCFERGEEATLNFRQIHAYMERKGIVPDSTWAVHLKSNIETGKIGIAEGPMMAGAIFFDITLEGQGGHGSRPDESVNPISAFTALYERFQSLRLEKINPFETLAYSIGSVQGGFAPNVIPQTLNFKGSARFLNREEAGYPFYDLFKQNVEDYSKTFGVTPTFHMYPKPGFPVVNDVEAAKFAKKVIGEEIGVENIVDPEPWMASESFSAYLVQWPGVFAFVGVKNEEKGIGAAHHNEYFDIDEDALALGATGAVTYAINFLNSDLEFEEKEFKGRYREYLVENGATEEEIDIYYSVDVVDTNMK